MPKQINYADRFEGIREAVYVLTLEQGVEAVSLAAVADWLQLSPRTVQRLLASVASLPLLGLQWADKRQRLRLFNRRPSTQPTSEQALEGMLETMPGREDAQDRQVWWALVSAHEVACDWARAARVQHEKHLDDLSIVAVADLPAEARDFEARRLHLVVSGAIVLICSGACSYDEAAALIRRHVIDLHTARLQSSDDAA